MAPDHRDSAALAGNAAAHAPDPHDHRPARHRAHRRLLRGDLAALQPHDGPDRQPAAHHLRGHRKPGTGPDPRGRDQQHHLPLELLRQGRIPRPHPQRGVDLAGHRRHVRPAPDQGPGLPARPGPRGQERLPDHDGQLRSARPPVADDYPAHPGPEHRRVHRRRGPGPPAERRHGDRRAHPPRGGPGRRLDHLGGRPLRHLPGPPLVPLPAPDRGRGRPDRPRRPVRPHPGHRAAHHGGGLAAAGDQHDAHPERELLRRPGRGPGADDALRLRCLPRAAHPPGRHPRLRRALPDGRGAREQDR